MKGLTITDKKIIKPIIKGRIDYYKLDLRHCIDHIKATNGVHLDSYNYWIKKRAKLLLKIKKLNNIINKL